MFVVTEEEPVYSCKSRNLVVVRGDGALVVGAPAREKKIV